MAGRPRKIGERYPSGDLRKDHRGSKSGYQERYAPAEIKRATDAAMAGLRDAHWGTVLGRFYLTGKLTGAQHAAGKRWAETWDDYCVAMGLPSPHPKSLVIGAPSRGEPPDPDSDAGRAAARSAERARKRFEAAHKILIREGMQAEKAVRDICEGVGKSPIGHEQFLHALRGLTALAKFWS